MHFSFRFNSHGRNLYSDGLNFFLSPAGSVIPDKHFTAGEGLGLASSNKKCSWRNHHFVIAKFYIYTNYYDPRGDHVGINVKSMQS